MHATETFYAGPRPDNVREKYTQSIHLSTTISRFRLEIISKLLQELNKFVGR